MVCWSSLAKAPPLSLQVDHAPSVRCAFVEAVPEIVAALPDWEEGWDLYGTAGLQDEATEVPPGRARAGSSIRSGRRQCRRRLGPLPTLNCARFPSARYATPLP